MCMRQCTNIITFVIVISQQQVHESSLRTPSSPIHVPVGALQVLVCQWVKDRGIFIEVLLELGWELWMVAIFSMIIISRPLNDSNLAIAVSLTVAIISVFWKHKNDILPRCSGRNVRGRVDHTHAESSHSYALVITTFLISTYWATWNYYLCGFLTLACPYTCAYASDWYFPY